MKEDERGVHPYVTRWDEWLYEQGFEIEQLQKQQIAVGGAKARGSQREAEARVAASEGRDQFPVLIPRLVEARPLPALPVGACPPYHPHMIVVLDPHISLL